MCWPWDVDGGVVGLNSAAEGDGWSSEFFGYFFPYFKEGFDVIEGCFR